MKEEPMITLTEASDRTKIPRRTLAYGAEKGTLKTKKLGLTLYTTLEWIEEWKADPMAHRRPPKRKSKLS